VKDFTGPAFHESKIEIPLPGYNVYLKKSRYFVKNPDILMKNYLIGILALPLLILIAANDLTGQPWEFIKEKDGIRIYTRKEANSSLKSYKGEAYLHTKLEKVYELIGNPKNVDWWADDISEIKILLYEKGKHVQYYLVYDVSWPITDRDLAVDAFITTDPVTGIRTVEAKPLPNVIPERTDRIRIKKYWQKWTITPQADGTIHIVLEGFVDPGGSIPAWLYNMVITETPMKVIKSVKTHTE
jgi:hypothetical protein